MYVIGIYIIYDMHAYISMIFIFTGTKESLRQVQWWTKSSLSKQISVISGFDHAFVNSSKFPENEEPSLNSTYDNATMDIPWIPLKCCSVTPWGPTNDQQTHVSDGHGLSTSGRRRRKNPPTRRGSGLHLRQCGGKPPLLGLLHHLVNPLSNLHLVFSRPGVWGPGRGTKKKGGGKRQQPRTDVFRQKTPHGKGFIIARFCRFFDFFARIHCKFHHFVELLLEFTTIHHPIGSVLPKPALPSWALTRYLRSIDPSKCWHCPGWKMLVFDFFCSKDAVDWV